MDYPKIAHYLNKYRELYVIEAWEDRYLKDLISQVRGRTRVIVKEINIQELAVPRNYVDVPMPKEQELKPKGWHGDPKASFLYGFHWQLHFTQEETDDIIAPHATTTSFTAETVFEMIKNLLKIEGTWVSEGYAATRPNNFYCRSSCRALSGTLYGVIEPYEKKEVLQPMEVFAILTGLKKASAG